MNVEELKKKREEFQEKYNEELEESKVSDNTDVYEGVLKDIKRNIDKIDILIDIYDGDKKPQFMIIQLEKLYLWLRSGLDKEDYLKLNIEQKGDLFHQNIPDGWTYDKKNYPIDKKIKYLEIAIAKNISLIDLEGVYYL